MYIPGYIEQGNEVDLLPSLPSRPRLRSARDCANRVNEYDLQQLAERQQKNDEIFESWLKSHHSQVEKREEKKRQKEEGVQRFLRKEHVIKEAAERSHQLWRATKDIEKQEASLLRQELKAMQQYALSQQQHMARGMVDRGRAREPGFTLRLERHDLLKYTGFGAPSPPSATPGPPGVAWRASGAGRPPRFAQLWQEKCRGSSPAGPRGRAVDASQSRPWSSSPRCGCPLPPHPEPLSAASALTRPLSALPPRGNGSAAIPAAYPPVRITDKVPSPRASAPTA